MIQTMVMRRHTEETRYNALLQTLYLTRTHTQWVIDFLPYELKESSNDWKEGEDVR